MRRYQIPRRRDRALRDMLAYVETLRRIAAGQTVTVVAASKQEAERTFQRISDLVRREQP